MAFINMEATEDSQQNQPLTFSDDDDRITNDEMENFIDDSEQPREGVSFYRKFDPDNLNHYRKFPNQTRDPRTAVYGDDEMYLGEEDQQPELYVPENRDIVELDKLLALKYLSKKFKKP